MKAIDIARLAYKKGYRTTKDGRVKGLRVGYLNLTVNSNGYHKFSVLGRISCPVRWLVAYEKYGEKLARDDIQVRHLNGDSLDDSWDNIAIGSSSENCMDKSPEVRKNAALTAGRARSNLSADDVKRIRYLREELGWTYAQILKRYPMAKSTLSYICNYRTWKDV